MGRPKPRNLENPLLVKSKMAEAAQSANLESVFESTHLHFSHYRFKMKQDVKFKITALHSDDCSMSSPDLAYFGSRSSELAWIVLNPWKTDEKPRGKLERSSMTHRALYNCVEIWRASAHYSFPQICTIHFRSKWSKFLLLIFSRRLTCARLRVTIFSYYYLLL